jgi:isopenicillin N synthase-like dioxygenase
MEVPAGSGTFVDVESEGKDECIINVGDCLHKWTGLHSARHRVHLPDPAGDVVDERFSVAYFAKPDRNASLCPLLDGIGTEKEAAAGYMTAGEFQNMRIAGTY